MDEVSIGEAARQSGVKVPTIRYYEEIGLLPAPVRSESQRRLYGESDLKRLAFIRHARELGFEMGSIRTLLSLQDNPSQSCAAADAIARGHLHEVEMRITRLQALHAELSRMIEHCATASVADCRVIETLANDSHEHGRLM